MNSILCWQPIPAFVAVCNLPIACIFLLDYSASPLNPGLLQVTAGVVSLGTAVSIILLDISLPVSCYLFLVIISRDNGMILICDISLQTLATLGCWHTSCSSQPKVCIPASQIRNLGRLTRSTTAMCSGSTQYHYHTNGMFVRKKFTPFITKMGNERENSCRKMISRGKAHTNLFDIFQRSQMSFSIRRE